VRGRTSLREVSELQEPPAIETRQLLLRAPIASDVDPLFEIQRDADAMQYTYCAPDREATVKHLRDYADRFSIDGFAPWTAVCKENERVAGWGGLNCDPKEPQWGTEVAYFIHRNYWGRGFASEIVAASLGLAFDQLDLAEVRAFTRPANLASARVLEKAGLSFVEYVPQLERNYFKISCAQWKGGS
jgi:ribosomal-protein-alanine N-acetyltransferase